MFDWISVLLLGVIEGLTEFIPVSSTGHMLIAQQWLKPQSELFNVVIQCGAVLAVLAVFTGRVKELLSRWQEPANKDYILKLGAAFLLTAVGGLILKKAGWKLPESAVVVAWATLVGGVIILLVEKMLGGKARGTTVTWQIALAVGAAQLLAAALPGTSRSGATILIALAMGLARPAAAEFSFLLGIPTLLAAGGYEIFSAYRHHELGQEKWSHLLAAALVAAITAFVVVKWLLKYVQNHTFVVFGWYRIVLGAVILGLHYWK